MPILIASNNVQKIQEIQSILNQFSIKSVCPKELNLKIDPLEKGKTFLENAYIKAEEFSEAIGGRYPVLSDDSGLCIDYLKGEPGIYSARYGSTGQKILTSFERCSLILEKIEKATSRKAIFVTNLCLYLDKHRFISIEEILKGSISKTISQDRDALGYDPIFIPHEKNLTLSELSLKEKNIISARGKAFQKILACLPFYKI